jgi:hypothetical protein
LVIADTGNYSATYDDGTKAAATLGPINIIVVPLGALPVAGAIGLGLLTGMIAFGSALKLRRRK